MSLPYYTRVTRYTTSAFTRAQIGDALARGNSPPHIFDNHDALASLKDRGSPLLP